MVSLLIGLTLGLCIPLLFLFLESKTDYIYLKGAKIPARYFRTIAFMWIGGYVGIIIGIILSKFLNNQFIVKIVIIFFVLIGYLLAGKNKYK